MSPRKVAESIKTMQLKYATITGVARDDLEDEGAWLYAETIRAVHEAVPGCGVEMLAPDFSGHAHLLNQVFEMRPESLLTMLKRFLEFSRRSAPHLLTRDLLK